MRYFYFSSIASETKKTVRLWSWLPTDVHLLLSKLCNKYATIIVEIIRWLSTFSLLLLSVFSVFSCCDVQFPERWYLVSWCLPENVLYPESLSSLSVSDMALSSEFCSFSSDVSYIRSSISFTAVIAERAQNNCVLVTFHFAFRQLNNGAQYVTIQLGQLSLAFLQGC